jgi:hypothetical protein
MKLFETIDELQMTNQHSTNTAMLRETFSPGFEVSRVLQSSNFLQFISAITSFSYRSEAPETSLLFESREAR